MREREGRGRHWTSRRTSSERRLGHRSALPETLSCLPAYLFCSGRSLRPHFGADRQFLRRGSLLHQGVDDVTSDRSVWPPGISDRSAAPRRPPSAGASTGRCARHRTDDPKLASAGSCRAAFVLGERAQSAQPANALPSSGVTRRPDEGEPTSLRLSWGTEA